VSAEQDHTQESSLHRTSTLFAPLLEFTENTQAWTLRSDAHREEGAMPPLPTSNVPASSLEPTMDAELAVNNGTHTLFWSA
jgi:hypothetical protein